MVNGQVLLKYFGFRMHQLLYKRRQGSVHPASDWLMTHLPTRATATPSPGSWPTHACSSLWHYMMHVKPDSDVITSFSDPATKVRPLWDWSWCLLSAQDWAVILTQETMLTFPATWGCSCSCCAGRWHSEPNPRTLWIYWAGLAASSPKPYLQAQKNTK